MPGSLFVVATPIGHLKDLSDRARETLNAVSAIVCEDTRVTRKLLSAHRIERPLVAHHAHSPPEQVADLTRRLEAGEDLALVSDAGTPLLSDPGIELVSRAIGLELPVIPIPGPSALLAALVGSGLPPQPFVFLGFLPRAASAQRELVAPLARLPLTLVVYEAPSRVVKTLEQLSDVCGKDRPACVARELTKRFETFERGTLETLVERFQAGTRGEMVVVVGPASATPTAGDRSADLAAEAHRLVALGVGASEAARTLAGAFGIPKREAYQAVLAAAGPREGDS